MPAIMEDWLRKSSTVASSTFSLPTIPDGFDYGFELPQPPATTKEAIAVMNKLRAPDGLPVGWHFNEHADGLRRNRLTFAICKLVLQCLDVWASDPANQDKATVKSQGRVMRIHQLSPLVVCYNNGAARQNSYRGWWNAMDAAVARGEEATDVMDNELPYAGTVEQCTMGHRVSSSSIYLVSTKNHPVYEFSFLLRSTKRQLQDPTQRERALRRLRDLEADQDRRLEHMARGGEDYHVAVHITKPRDSESKHVYIFDPAFLMEDWPKPKPPPSPEAVKAEKRARKEAEERRETPPDVEKSFVKRRELSNLTGLHRVRELIDHLKKPSNPRDKQLQTARFFIGGGGNEASECRPMAIKWAVGVVCTQMMRLDGEDAAMAPPEHFSVDREEISWIEIRP